MMNGQDHKHRIIFHVITLSFLSLYFVFHNPLFKSPAVIGLLVIEAHYGWSRQPCTSALHAVHP